MGKSMKIWKENLSIDKRIICIIQRPKQSNEKLLEHKLEFQGQCLKNCGFAY